MVYCGKPSPACYSCRRRRIKCDRKQPGCTQCSKISIDCPGYRNPLDLSFRSENDNVIRRAQASYQTAPRKKRSRPVFQWHVDITNQDKLSRNDSLTNLRSFAEPEICSPLSLIPEDIGTSYFMTSYVPGSHYDYLPALYTHSRSHSALHTIIYATSMASLSREIMEPRFMELARKHYTKALELTNHALADVSTAIKDSTLVSVMLLSLFEAMVWDGNLTPTNWTIHTQGALALVKLRGAKQFQTEIGRRLFTQVSNNILVGCIQRKQHLPPEFINLASTASPFYEPQDPKRTLATILADLVHFLAFTSSQTLTPAETISKATYLDQKILSITQSLPPTWHYTETDLPSHNPDVYGTKIYTYPHHNTAQLWNSYRMLRILLNEIIHDSASLATNSPALFQTNALSNIKLMATQICASIPQFTRRSPREVDYKACIATLLWPLAAVRGASRAEEGAKKYARERLGWLKREVGIMGEAEEAGSEEGRGDALQDGYGYCIL
ncbi:hypothetical protein B0J11DRAFT_279259 [Dendryphion nanum]|uniref:Zn(2)-C6 fungal-type domain-containing protein n=1 Tax=Dendryphion nanum TaxID=256645 RepID=A0A9P9E112_9PLEO|nr:hypothetical protein B0J11DRAFT_279259 [Dendryphion nanum]